MPRHRPRLAPAVLLLALAAYLPLAQAAPPAEPAPSREHLAPAGWENAYHRYHYSPVVKVGDMVIVSGIPAAVGDTYEARVRWMFEELKAHLAAAGASLADVVEITTYHVQPKDSKGFGEEFDRFAPIHAEYFRDHYPAWSAVGTTALMQDGAPVEMRAVAILGSGRAPRADIPVPATAPAEATSDGKD
ncbi:Rid family hydrolase [Arenimonas sp. MALMAid1274]|uniref:Rid family hydrolase n=1 Tax=Arenimonas sp. MALMAid1274 TaxID=3411630 RepID=UPI003BA2FC25